MRAVLKMTVRSIRAFLGRYMALMLIVALSVGFFAGLKITTDAMLGAADAYLTAQELYDLRLMSTVGFTEDDAREFGELDGVSAVEGTYTTDALLSFDGVDKAYKLMSLTERINLPELVSGRMPERAGECVVDFRKFSEEDIGKSLYLSENNTEEDSELISVDEFKIVGIVTSPLYISTERGTTDIGGGALYSYIYVTDEDLNFDVYTEINIKLADSAAIYSEEYEKITESREEEITLLCGGLVLRRYNGICDEYIESLAPLFMLSGLTAEDFKEDISPFEPYLTAVGIPLEEAEALRDFLITEPESYVLTRNENAGYVSFENDTAIINGIANIFPIFFIVIALLVCITTMTRMVDEERTQIGVLKAMGFGYGRVMAKYLLYAGSATLVGWAVGFFLSTWGMPEIFWLAYGVLYGFTYMRYLFDPTLAVLTLLISLVGILGATYLSCRSELRDAPANLIRPRASKAGKRIFLERIRPLWSRLAFLDKIVLRNMFRYKQRLFMMLIGIGCCAGLLLTAFGVRDSMIHIGSLQYEGIQIYDAEVSFEEKEKDAFTDGIGDVEGVGDYLLALSERVDLHADGTMSNVTLLSFADGEAFSEYWKPVYGGDAVVFPREGEAVINNKVAEKLGLTVGDSIEVKNADMKSVSLTVGGIFNNYIYNYILMSDATYASVFGEAVQNTALVKIVGDESTVAEALVGLPGVISTTLLSSSQEILDSAMTALDYIIMLVVAFCGALAFIVIFNLTNINIAERSREIATVEVLGFYPRETSSYVLRENLVLSVIAAFIGLPLGNLFHYAVMIMIDIDLFAFDMKIDPVSYLLALVLTVVFASLVNIFMRRQITKINMAESLKAVE